MRRDGNCGDVGELSRDLTIDLGDNQGEQPLCRVMTGGTTPAAAQSPLPLVTLDAGETVGLCTHAIWNGEASSQSDRVRFRIRFEALSGDVEPPAECVDDGAEEDDAIESARAYRGPTSAQLCAGDQDWFTYEHTGDDLQVELAFDEGQDLDFFVYDMTGTERFRGWTYDNPELQAAELPAGTYAVQVIGEGPARSPYTLTVSSVDLPDVEEPPACEDDQYEPNDSMAEAPLIAGQNQATICPGDDDYFAYFHEGGDLPVELAFVHAVGDLDLELIGPNGDVVADSDGIQDTESILLEDAVGGTYIIRVLGYQGDAGDYTLTVGAT